MRTRAHSPRRLESVRDDGTVISPMMPEPSIIEEDVAADRHKKCVLEAVDTHKEGRRPRRAICS